MRPTTPTHGITGGSPELRKDLPAIAREFYRHCRPAHMTLCMLARHTDRIIRLADGHITSDTANTEPILAGTPRPDAEL